MHFTQLRYQDPRTRTYLGSPSLVRLPGGNLLAAHDYFGPGCPRNHEGEEHLLSLYRSGDDGQTWHNLAHVANAYWSSLFIHRDSVYLLGTSQQYGSIVIRRSDDGGYTWTHPQDDRSGLLFPGGSYREPPNYHCAPVPVLEHAGRLYRAFEDCTPCAWGSGFQALVISAAVDADLLEADSWTLSDRLPLDPAWAPAHWRPPENLGWLEGNIVAAPDGTLWDLLRVNSAPEVDRAALVRVEDGGRRLSFDPATGFIDFPGGMSKFTIRRDPQTGLYLSLVNDNHRPGWPRQRNVLSLTSSPDLRTWQSRRTLLAGDAHLGPEESLRQVGFQYVDWQFDGDDLIYLVRTAYGGARNYHDSNRITFHRLVRFRELLSGVMDPNL